MKTKHPLSPQSPSKTQITNSALSYIFKGQQLLGWQILDLQSCLYTESNVTIDGITLLISLYMKIIEKLNTLQDPRQQYFNLKMQKLMAEPYVIRCFNSSNKDSKKNALESRKKQLQQKVQKEVQRQNHRKVLQQVIIAQEQKQKKMKSRIQEIVEQSNRTLENRIKKRIQTIEMKNQMRNSSLLLSSQSSIPSQSSPRQNNKKYDRFLSRNSLSSEFQLNMKEDDYFYMLKREIDEQQQQQKLQRRLRKQKQ